MFIKVSEGNLVFDATAPNGLQISKDEPLLWWMNKYDEYHGVTTTIPMKTEVQWTRDSLKVDHPLPPNAPSVSCANWMCKVYNEQLGRRVHIHIVTPQYWEVSFMGPFLLLASCTACSYTTLQDLTGILPPITPVTRDMYATHGLPWYKIFDDYIDSITEVSNALASVLSIAELDNLKSDSSTKVADPVVNPDAPPSCFIHQLANSAFVFRPCGHAVCAQCFGLAFAQMAGGSTQCSCGSPIAKFVGMKQPVPQITMAQPAEAESDHETTHWNVKDIEQLSLHAAQSGKVVVIHRPEDSVAPLQQKEPVPPLR